jgi:hypothetical protein
MLETIIIFVFDWIETSSVVQTMYLSALTKEREPYFRDCQTSNFYYQTVQVNVDITGFYSFSSKSSLDTYSYIYKDNFNPLDPLNNLLSQDDNSCNDKQFKLIVELYTNTTYILVVTTYYPAKTGQFSILVFGLNNVKLNNNSKYL